MTHVRSLASGPSGAWFQVLSVCLLVGISAPASADFCPDAGTALPTSDAPSGDAPLSVHWCDLDGDGDPDLITANDASDTITILFNNGDGTYAPKVQWPVDSDPLVVSEPVDVVCCDVNGDNHVDLVTANHTSDDVSVLLNNGASQFPVSVKYTVGEAPFETECLNLDGDGDDDLVTSGFTADAISVLLNNGDGTFASHVMYAVGDGPIAMALCDVDGDTDLDVVTANMLGKEVSVMRNNADGTFTGIGSTALCTTPFDCMNPFDITCCDFDGANGPDVAVANGIDDSVAILFNDGSGGLGGLTVYEAGTELNGPYGITCCDVDNDSDADVVSANLASDNLAVFLNDGLGTLGIPSFLPVGVDSSADPSSVVCCDVDGDGDTDLVSAFEDGVTIFENDCGGGVCGDGIIDAGEDCDDLGESATCDADCTFAVCGDGTFNVTAGEQCDDGNNDPGDGCSATCQTEPGEPIPAASTWGMITLALLVLSGATVVLRWRFPRMA